MLGIHEYFSRSSFHRYLVTGTTYLQHWPVVTTSVGHTGKISRFTIAELVRNICDGTFCGFQ